MDPMEIDADAPDPRERNERTDEGKASVANEMAWARRFRDPAGPQPEPRVEREPIADVGSDRDREELRADLVTEHLGVRGHEHRCLEKQPPRHGAPDARPSHERHIHQTESDTV